MNDDALIPGTFYYDKKLKFLRPLRQIQFKEGFYITQKKDRLEGIGDKVTLEADDFFCCRLFFTGSTLSLVSKLSIEID
jgi:hypothetical protein